MLEPVWIFVGLGISPTRPVLESVSSFGTWGVFLTRPLLDCPVVCQVGSFYYTPRAGICLVVWRLRSFSDTPGGGFCLIIQSVGSFSYTPRAVGLFVGLGVSPRRPVFESVSSSVRGELFCCCCYCLFVSCFLQALCWSDHDRCLRRSRRHCQH